MKKLTPICSIVVYSNKILIKLVPVYIIENEKINAYL